MANKIIHTRSSAILADGAPKLPEADKLLYGELAINFAAGAETISIKNKNDEIVEFKSKEYFESIIEENELITATALNNLNERLETIENTPEISPLLLTAWPDEFNPDNYDLVEEAFMSGRPIIIEVTYPGGLIGRYNVTGGILNYQDVCHLLVIHDNSIVNMNTIMDNSYVRPSHDYVAVTIDGNVVIENFQMALQLNGDGTKFLADNGEYVEITLPSKVSELENDAEYVDRIEIEKIELVVSNALNTLNTRVTNIEAKPDAEIPTKVSAFENDAEYVTKPEIIANEEAIAIALNDIDDRLLAVDDRIDELERRPSGPTKVSELENDAEYVTRFQASEKEEVVAAALNDLNDRLVYIEENGVAGGSGDGETELPVGLDYIVLTEDDFAQENLTTDKYYELQSLFESDKLLYFRHNNTYESVQYCLLNGHIGSWGSDGNFSFSFVSGEQEICYHFSYLWGSPMVEKKHISFQRHLTSGENIKTINGVSVLGSGNIEITAGTDINPDNYYTKSDIDSKGYLYKVVLTTAEYNALTEYDPQALYVISDAHENDNSNFVTEAQLNDRGFLTQSDKTEMQESLSSQNDIITALQQTIATMQAKINELETALGNTLTI